MNARAVAAERGLAGYYARLRRAVTEEMRRRGEEISKDEVIAIIVRDLEAHEAYQLHALMVDQRRARATDDYGQKKYAVARRIAPGILRSASRAYARARPEQKVGPAATGPKGENAVSTTVGDHWTRINVKFAGRIPPLNADELAALTESIKREGCRDPIVLRKGTNEVLDGHHRRDICLANGLGFETVDIDLPDEEACLRWIDETAVARRNLPPDVIALIRGRIYNAQKQQGERTDLTSGQSDQKLTTAETLAQQHGVSEKTIRRNGEFAAAVDEIEKAADPELGRKIMAGRGPSMKDVVEQARKWSDECTVPHHQSPPAAPNTKRPKNRAAHDRREVKLVWRNPAEVEYHHIHIAVKPRHGEGRRRHNFVDWLDELCESLEWNGDEHDLKIEVTLGEEWIARIHVPNAAEVEREGRAALEWFKEKWGYDFEAALDSSDTDEATGTGAVATAINTTST